MIFKLFRIELLSLWRNSQEWLYPIAFYLFFILFFPLTISESTFYLQKIFPSFIWLAALFTNLLYLQNLFHADLEDGAMEQLFFCTTPLSVIIGIKLFAHWLISNFILILITPFIGVFFQIPSYELACICLTLLIGTPILTMLVAFCLSLTIGLKQIGVLMSLLVMPLITPVIIFGVNLTQQYIAGFDVLGGFAFFLGLSLLAVCLMPIAIAESLRLSVS